jgi:hypothetical protein
MEPTKFLEGLGSKLAEKWVATLLTPAFLFWAGGLVACIYKLGWMVVKTHLEKLSNPLQIAVSIIALLVVTASAFAIQRFDLMALRIAEGYWPRWLRPLRRLFLHRMKQQINSVEARLDQLIAKQETQSLTLDELEDVAQLETQLRFVPTQPERQMPTQLGNIIRAAERRPQEKYGLDTIICWPHLWLLLPDSTRNELQSASANLANITRIWLWSILFLVWTPLAWWVLPVSGLIAFFAYGWMLEAARSFSKLVEAAFDLHRILLYQSLHWPLPTNSDEEQDMGSRLSEYLWRGPVRGPVTYIYST